MKKYLLNIGLSVLSLLLTAAFVEILLRQIAPHQQFFIWPPYTTFSYDLESPEMPGIDGVSNFTINSQGIRGREFSDQDSYRLLVIGGSTAECAVLDDDESWPHLLEAFLRKKWRNKNVWVGNIGKSGHSSANHLLAMQHLLDQYPPIDAVLVLLGVNDLLRRLAMDSSYFPQLKDSDLLGKTFSIRPRSFNERWYKKTEWWILLKDAKRSYLAYRNKQVDKQENLRKLMRAREKRRNNPQRDTLPNLTSALNDYRETIGKMQQLMTNKKARLLVASQPVLWKDQMPPHEYTLLWMGEVGKKSMDEPAEYYTPGVLSEAMRLYNQTLARSARDYGIEFIDLARFIPRDTTVFYDDCHFNENGARKVAEIIADHL
jgi:lysophospholipase L1-like esterase